MVIMSNDDIADFPQSGLATDENATASNLVPAAEPIVEAVRDKAESHNKTGHDGAVPGEMSDTLSDTVPASDVAVAGVWVLWRKHADGETETVRAFDDEVRARADLELAESVSGDQFWLTAVPLIETASDRESAPHNLSRVQALALTWLAQGAEAEASVPLDDPVVVSPRHVRGFVSVPSHEWREMEDNGWVRDGLVTPSGAEQVGLVRRSSDHGVG